MSSNVKIEKLQFDHLSFKFEGQDPIFEDVSFDFPMNQFVWVKAEHGQGRSSLLQILAGIQAPTKGHYTINGQNVDEMTFDEFLPYRLSIGYGFDMGGLIHNRTLFENLILPLEYHNTIPNSEAQDRVYSYIKDFGLLKYKDQRPSFIPGGSKKLACLLRAIIMHPQMLLLDDPTVGLSQETALHYFDLLQILKSKHGLEHIILSSYDDKFMGLIDATEIYIEGGLIHQTPEWSEKKVVGL